MHKKGCIGQERSQVEVHFNHCCLIFSLFEEQSYFPKVNIFPTAGADTTEPISCRVLINHG